MANSWQKKRLADICELKPAKSEARKLLKGADAVSFVPMEDLGTFTKDFLPTRERKFADVSGSYTYFADGDVLMAKITPCFENGKIGIAKKLKNGIGFGSSEFFVLRPKGEVQSEYLYYTLLTDEFRNSGRKRMTGAVGHKRVPKEYLENYQIELPSLVEQRQITKTLDEIFQEVSEAKDRTEKNLRNAKMLFESYLHDTFESYKANYGAKKLKDVAEYFIGLTYSPKNVRDEGTIVLRSSNIQNDRLDFSDLVRVDCKVKDSLMIKNGDILMCSRNGSKRLVGKTALITNVSEEMTFGTFMTVIRSPYNPYLYWFFKSNEFRKQIGVGNNPMINQITKYMLDDLLVPIPDPAEQKSTVKKLNTLSEDIRKLESVYEKKLDALEELKRSVLKQALFQRVPVLSPIQHPQVVAPSPYIRNQVHAAIIEQVTRDGGSTTEVAVAKYDHLLQELFGLSLGYQFATHQFGPFDAQIKRLVSSGLGRNKWFTKRSGMIVFGLNIDALLSRQSNLYRSAQASMKELSRLGITKRDADSVELLSTVCHSIKETGSTTLETIRDFMSKWQTDNNRRTKAEKFSAERTQKCIDFIISNDLQQRLLSTP